ncbi:MAG TPA: methionine synthase [Candidatus Eisenbacteria bacterium]|nr:methionine synthase [Candidatus Eisenbacteria bacterium]
MPGTDPREAVAVALDAVPDLPFLPELPARGPGADMLGRAAALLEGLHVDLQPSGWRLVDRPGRDERRARSFLDEDLDALEERAAGYDGPVKLAVAGPWTLAAALRLTRGEAALSDHGARRDLVDSLAEGLGAHLRDVARRLPAARLVVQLDEPSLPNVLAGRVRTFSGYRTLAAVEAAEAQGALSRLVGALDAPVVVHCCAADVPVALLRAAGAAGISLDLRLAGERLDDPLGETLEAGGLLLAGVVPVTGGLSDPAATVEPVRRLWRRLGLAPELASRQVVVTPTCGLAGATPDQARAALRRAAQAAQVLVDDPEG